MKAQVANLSFPFLFADLKVSESMEALSEGKGIGRLGEKGERIKQKQNKTKPKSHRDTDNSMVISRGKGR